LPPKDSPIVLNEPLPSFADRDNKEERQQELQDSTTSSPISASDQTACEWNDTMVYRDEATMVSQPLDTIEGGAGPPNLAHDHTQACHYQPHHHYFPFSALSFSETEQTMRMRPPQRDFDDLPPHV
jgi:hypothetical protein